MTEAFPNAVSGWERLPRVSYSFEATNSRVKRQAPEVPGATLAVNDSRVSELLAVENVRRTPLGACP
jgi:hypothetical protein